MNDGNLVPMKKTCFERRKSSLSRSFELYLNVTVLMNCGLLAVLQKRNSNLSCSPVIECRPILEKKVCIKQNRFSIERVSFKMNEDNLKSEGNLH